MKVMFLNVDLAADLSTIAIQPSPTAGQSVCVVVLDDADANARYATDKAKNILSASQNWESAMLAQAAETIRLARLSPVDKAALLQTAQNAASIVPVDKVP